MRRSVSVVIGESRSTSHKRSERSPSRGSSSPGLRIAAAETSARLQVDVEIFQTANDIASLVFKRAFVRGMPWCLSEMRDFRGMFEQPFEQHAHLDTGKRRAGASVRSAAESDVFLDLRTVQLEGVRGRPSGGDRGWRRPARRRPACPPARPCPRSSCFAPPGARSSWWTLPAAAFLPGTPGSAMGSARSLVLQDRGSHTYSAWRCRSAWRWCPWPGGEQEHCRLGRLDECPAACRREISRAPARS